MSTASPPWFGAAYYPEDWPASQIDTDIELMKRAGMNVMRMAEFAWKQMEPVEGTYDFGWLHDVVARLDRAGIASVLGTPTATPPAWLTQRYPEVLRVDENGRPATHGARRNVCANNPVYRELCGLIVEKMGEEFGKDAAVIAWQIDNEVHVQGHRGCCCTVCQEKFADSLERRYRTIETLNAAWNLNLFSMAYDSFSQIPFPRPDVWHHPSLITAWQEFQGDSQVDFCVEQADILHVFCRQPVGHDMMPILGVSHARMNRFLDVAMFNHYNSTENLWQVPFWMDVCRPLKPAPFWNTETSTCWFGGTTASAMPEPGFVRANSWIPFALGGEANLYWLWRTHWAGHELMHGSVLSAAGRPLHIFPEVQEIGTGLRAAAPFLTGTRPASPGVALHLSTTAHWMLEYQPMVKDFQYRGAMIEKVYRVLAESHRRVDIIDPAHDLQPYRVVLTPFLPWLGEDDLDTRVKAWIESGGTWVAGPFTDVRNADAAKFTHAPYGVLEDWTGARNVYEIPGDPRQFRASWAGGGDFEGSLWYDSFAPGAAEAMATYAEGPMKGLAAIVTRKMGKGRIILLGTLPEPAALGDLLARVAADAGLAAPPVASPHLLVAPREGTAGRGVVAVEMAGREASLAVAKKSVDLISGNTHAPGTVTVPAYGVVVLREI
jgi:beta-galactosidase